MKIRVHLGFWHPSAPYRKNTVPLRMQSNTGKRPLADSEADESNAASFKKRASVAVDGGESSSALNNDQIEQFQREAIFREMQVYKIRLQKAEQQLASREQEHKNQIQLATRIQTQWNTLNTDLEMIARRLNGSETMDLDGIPSSVVIPLISYLFLEQKPTTALLKVLFQSCDEQELDEELKMKSQISRALVDSIVASLSKPDMNFQSPSASDLDGLQAKLHDSLNQLSHAQSELEQKTAESKDLRDKVGVLEDETVTLERKTLRLQKKLNEFMSREPESAATSSEVPVSATSEADSKPGATVPNNEKQEASDASANNSLTPEVIQQLKEIDQLREDADEARQLADLRSKELENLRQENATIRSELTQLQVDIQAIPEHVIRESGAYRALVEQTEYQRASVNDYKSKLEQVQARLKELEEERLGIFEKLKTENSNIEGKYSAECKRLAADLTRVRGVRDQIQQQLEAEKAKKGKDSGVMKSLQSNAEANRNLVKCLIEDLRRIKLRMAAGTGDQQLYETVLFACEVLDGARNSQEDVIVTEADIDAKIPELRTIVGSLQKELQKSRDEVAVLQEKLAGTESNGNEQLIEEKASIQKQLSAAAQELQRYETLFGRLDEHSTPESSTSHLKTQLQEFEKKMEKLELQLKSYQQTESAMMMEIETISSSFTKLEAQHRDQLQNIQSKDSQITKLLAEKVKQDQKIAMVRKEKDSMGNKNLALSKDTQKQSELIKTLQETEVQREEYIVKVEKELSYLKSVLHVHERKTRDAVQLAEELAAKIEKSSSKYSEVTGIIKQRDQAVESIKATSHQLEEENKKLNNKIKHLQRRLQSSTSHIYAGDESLTAGMSTDELQDELKTLRGWKKIAQCGVCEFRVKDTCITRCMHVFCKECIDKRLETRQRKCPQCGGMFGPGDVKAIYI